VWREIGEGLRLVMGNGTLRAFAACNVTLTLSMYTLGAVYLLYVSRELGFAPAVLGLLFAVGGASSFLGALAAGRLAARFGVGPSVIGALLIGGLAQLFIPAAQGATVVAAALLIAHQLLGDSNLTVYNINELSLRQTITPDGFRGRVNGSMRFLSFCGMLGGSLAGGLLGEAIGLRLTLVVGGTGMALAALWLIFSSVRGLRAAGVSEAEGIVGGAEAR
jgi:predicted MFS family arabinose efflux permease